MSVIIIHFHMLAYYHLFFFFNDTATTEIYTLSLHDALPISRSPRQGRDPDPAVAVLAAAARLLLVLPLSLRPRLEGLARSEEHTSELQSRLHLVCRLLLEKKKTYAIYVHRQIPITILLCIIL